MAISLFKKFPFKETFTLADGRAINAEIRLNRGGRSLRMRMARDLGSLIISVPDFANIEIIKKFVNSNQAWINKNLQNQEQIEFKPNAIIPILGMPTILEMGKPRTKVSYQQRENFSQISSDAAWELSKTQGYYAARLVIPSNELNFAEKARVAIKKLAQKNAQNFIEEFVPKLTRRPAKLSIRDTKSRWGSCNSNGDLMFSWRLIFAPEAVFKEVVAHELAHLKEMNHSKAFYAEMARIYPEYKNHTDWLKHHGRKLYLIG